VQLDSASLSNGAGQMSTFAESTTPRLAESSQYFLLLRIKLISNYFWHTRNPETTLPGYTVVRLRFSEENYRWIHLAF